MQVIKNVARRSGESRQRALLGQLSDLDIRLLRVFKSVVECGGMAAAELELNISTSTISRHVKDLETRLRLILCRRGRGGFALTAEGEQVYRETLRLLASIEAFRGSIDDLHRRLAGPLNVAVFDKTVTNPAARLPQALALFSECAPEVALHLHIGSINAIERGIIDGQYQIGIIPTHRASDSLNYLPLFDEVMQLYCGSAHALAGIDTSGLEWPDLHAHAFAGLGYHSPNMELSRRMQLRRVATASDQEAVAMLILSGKYLGFLPDHYARRFVDEGRMKPLRPGHFGYDVQFVTIMRRGAEPTRVVQAFVDCLERAHADVRG